MERGAVLLQLDASPETGLSSEAAATRLREHGPNVLAEIGARSDLAIFLGQFASLPVGLLGISAGISIATGGLVDTVTIGIVFVINALVGFTTERQPERTIAALSRPPRRTVAVIREGAEVERLTEEIVPGDV